MPVSEKRKAQLHAWNHSPNGKRLRAAWQKTPRGRAAQIRRTGATLPDGSKICGDHLQALEELQNFACAVCSRAFVTGKKSGRTKCFDHDHQTLIGRGFLCHNCNVALGMLEAAFDMESLKIVSPVFFAYKSAPPLSRLYA